VEDEYLPAEGQDLAVAALLQLGYSRREIEQALAQVAADGEEAGEEAQRVRAALKVLRER